MNRDEVGLWFRRACDRVGFGNYDLVFEPDRSLGDKYAEVEVRSDQVHTVTLCLDVVFWELSGLKQMEVLLHEAIHGRFSLYASSLEEVTSELEEALVVDVTRLAIMDWCPR